MLKQWMLFGIERMEKYNKVQDNRTAETKTTNWLLVAVISVAAALSVLVLLNN